MIRVKRDIHAVAMQDLYRERLAQLILQIDLLACAQCLSTRKLVQRDRKDRIRIRHTVSFLRHQMDIDDLADLHVCDRCVKSADHHACTADELDRLTAVIGRIKLASVIQGTTVMDTALSAYVASFQRILATVTAMAAAFMTAAVMVAVMVMMIASRSRIDQFTLKISFNDFVGISLGACADFDACVCKCLLGTAADTAADQYIDCVVCKQAGKCTVTDAVGTDHFTGDDIAVLDIIDFKELCPAKMLKYISLIISYCNFHFCLPSLSDLSGRSGRTVVLL